MRQNILEINYGPKAVQAGEIRSRQPRRLTCDESKAAEAAFQGQAFNPSWSAAAHVVYEGIAAVLKKDHSGEDDRMDFNSSDGV